MSIQPTTKSNSRTNRLVSSTALLAGFNKHVPATQSIMIAGTTYTHTMLEQALQDIVNADTAVVTTRAAWQNAVKADKEKLTQEHPFLVAFRQTMVAMFGTDIATLADFGLSQRKTPVVSPATRVAAAAKSKATRTARHTMGKVQKAGIKGDATAVVTPKTAPPAASTPVSAAAPSTATVTAAAAPAPVTAAVPATTSHS
jgi:peptidoglycan hydrolase CwlO-like protein